MYLGWPALIRGVAWPAAATLERMNNRNAIEIFQFLFEAIRETSETNKKDVKADAAATATGSKTIFECKNVQRDSIIVVDFQISDSKMWNKNEIIYLEIVV